MVIYGLLAGKTEGVTMRLKSLKKKWIIAARPGAV